MPNLSSWGSCSVFWLEICTIVSEENGLLMVFLSNIIFKLMKKNPIKSRVYVLKRTFLAPDKSAFKRFLFIYIMDLQGLYTYRTSSTMSKNSPCNKNSGWQGKTVLLSMFTTCFLKKIWWIQTNDFSHSSLLFEQKCLKVPILQAKSCEVYVAASQDSRKFITCYFSLLWWTDIKIN